MASHQPLTRVRPIIRVFVSSTFSDLKVERDALARRVFPQLEQRCLKDGFQFHAIDLRWGVSTEAGLDHRTMRICFEELRRAQDVSPEPNFLILLGNRYGWRPLPEEISAAEFHSLELAAERIDAMSQQPRSIDIMRRWYRLDENALPPVYILQPRRKPQIGEPNGTDYTTSEAWREVEQDLWPIINRAFPPKGMMDRFTFSPASDEIVPSIVRFQASATEQEIWAGALSVSNADQHVRAFFRDINNRDEFPPADVRDYFDVTQSNAIDVELAAAQEDLKSAIRTQLGNDAIAPIPFTRLKRKNGKTVIDSSEEEIQKFCDDVQTRLWAIIERQIKEFWEPRASYNQSGQLSPDRRTARELEIERDEHLRFGKERGSQQTFVGRTDQLARILGYIANDSQLPLVIHGDSGCGKTALLARAFDEIPKEQQPIVRFIGVTPRSSNLRGLLSSLCRELRQRKPIEGPIPTDIRELVAEFQKHIGPQTAPREPVILFLDALDQIADEDNARSLYWIPTGPLPAQVKIILTCLSDRDEDDPIGLPYHALRRRCLPAENMLKLDALSIDDAKMLVFDRWLRTAGRTVNEVQQRIILERLESEVCRQPLYLKLLFEEVKLWRSYDKTHEPGRSVPELLEQLFARLSLETNHGPCLIERALGYIAAARRGLSETEILEFLFADRKFRRRILKTSLANQHRMSRRPKRIPVVIWSRLRSDLAPYLTERAAPGGDVLTLYHRQVAEWVKARFVDAVDWNPHRHLADYFERQPLWYETNGGRGPNIRRSDELPWQRIQAADWDGVERVLCDLKFIEAKCTAGMTFELVRDFSEAMGALPEFQQEQQAERDRVDRLRQYGEGLVALSRNLGPLLSPPDTRPTQESMRRTEARSSEPRIETPTHSRLARVQAYANFVSSHSHLLANFPNQSLPVALNHAADGLVVEQAIDLIRFRSETWLRRDPRPPAPPAQPLCVRTLEGHKDKVTSVAIAPHGKTAISGSWDQTLRVWDVGTGSLLHTQEGHTGFVFAVALTPDGTTAISASLDNTVRVWEVGMGKLLRTLQGPADWVNDVAITPDGKIAVLCLGSGDNALVVWNVSTGAVLRTLDGHTNGVNAVALTPDGKTAVSAGGDKTLRVWDVGTGKLLRMLVGPSNWVTAVSLTPDGKTAVSASDDKTVCVWDINTGALLRTLEGHTHRVNSVALTPDGKTAVSASDDLTLRVWDVDTGALLRKLDGHTDRVFSVDVAADGSSVVSGSYDNSLRVWDVGRGAVQRTIEGHTPYVTAIVLTPDGKTAVTGGLDSTLRVWDVDTGALLRTLKGHTGFVNTVALIPDEKAAVSAGYDQILRVWDVGTGRLLRTLEGHTDFVSAVAVTADGKRAVSASRDKSLRVWDIATGTLVRTLEGHASGVGAVALTTDGKTAVSGSGDKTLRVWDVATGTLVRTLEGHASGVGAVALTPDGKTAVSAGGDKTLRVWDVGTGALLWTLKGHAVFVKCVVITPDGKTAISAGGDNIMRVWDIGTGALLRTLEGHTSWIHALALMPDGKTVVSGGDDKTLRVWDASTGQAIAVDPLEALCCSVATATRDRIVAGTYSGQLHFLTLQNWP